MDEHGIRLDLARAARVGFDEAIYCAGKSVAQIDAIVAQALATQARRFYTRLDEAKLAGLAPYHRDALQWDPVSRTAMQGELRAPAAPRVAVISGGSSDLPVAREAVRTLAFHGEGALEAMDIGVAGLWRLMERLEELRPMKVVIVAAGMEGALTSVVGGLLPGAIVALPTSVGYGVAEGGRVALQSALASCAPGIVTVNIDNGYGAACAALRVLRASSMA